MKGERFISKNWRQKMRCRAIKPNGGQCCCAMRHYVCGVSMCDVHWRILKEELKPISFVEI